MCALLCGETGSLCAEGKGVNLEFSTQPLGREQAFPDTEDKVHGPLRKYQKEVPSGGSGHHENESDNR